MSTASEEARDRESKCTDDADRNSACDGATPPLELILWGSKASADFEYKANKQDQFQVSVRLTAYSSVIVWRSPRLNSQAWRGVSRTGHLLMLTYHLGLKVPAH
jgi:hypothetical protein